MKRFAQRAGWLLALVMVLSMTFGIAAAAETNHTNWFDFQKLYPRLAPGEEMTFQIVSTRGIHIIVLDNTDKMTRVAYRGGSDDNNYSEMTTLICGANETADNVRIVVYNGQVSDGRYDIINLKVVKDGGPTDGRPSKQAGKPTAAEPAPAAPVAAAPIPATPIVPVPAPIPVPTVPAPVSGGTSDVDNTTIVIPDTRVADTAAQLVFTTHPVGQVTTFGNGYFAVVTDENAAAIATFALEDPTGLVPFTVSNNVGGLITITAPTTTAKAFALNISAADKANLAARGITGACVNGVEVAF